MPQKLYHFTHSSPEIITLADLLADTNSPVFLYNSDPEGFLKIVGEDGLTNRQRIEATYTLPEDKIYIGAKFSKLPLKVGTLLYLEFEKVNKPSFLTAGIEVVSNDEPAFKAKELARLEADTGYYAINRPIHGQQLDGISQEFSPDVSVWIWCKSLSSKSDETSTEMSGQIFNLTPFIQKCITNSSKSGGNFQLTLPPLVCELDRTESKWVLKKSTIDHYKTELNNSQQGEGYVAQGSLYASETFQENPNKASDDVLVRSQFLFHNIISPNDMVFIRFETLQMEKDKRYVDENEFYIDKSNLAGQIYDMIGLVDSNTQTVTPQNNDVVINISGRDLSKLLLEDGCYFYALENSQGILKFSGQSTQKNSLLNRIFADNGMAFIGLYQFNSIEYILKFIMQQLSNIKIVPNDLFNSYGDRRNKYFTALDIQNPDQRQLELAKKQSLSKLQLIRSQANRKDGDETKKQEEIFFNMVKFLETIRKENKRKTNNTNNTLGWQSFLYNDELLDEDTLPQYFAINLLNKKGEIPPSINEFIVLVDKYVDLSKPTQVFKEKLAAGVWQIVDLVIDKSVAGRRLADSSFSTANGCLLNFFHSACQDPLVEFYMDTYGDKFHFIVRRPPYDQKGLISLIEGKVNTEDGKTSTPPAIVDVMPEDVLYESLIYDDCGVYSWYHFFPRNALIGSAQDYSLSYLGAVYFPEYAEIFGSKPFQQSHSYVPYEIRSNNSIGLGNDEFQAVEDMKYVIESNQYLPFTRKGVIKINRDRRLKIGNIFRYKSTGEIFFIEAVQHTFEITEGILEAVTVLQVSRGMIEQLIYGDTFLSESGKPEFVSYFNIIDTRLAFNKKQVKRKIVKKVKKATVNTKSVTRNNSTSLPFVSNKITPNSQIIEIGMNKGIGYLSTLDRHPQNKNLFINFINLINSKGYWVQITPLGANRTYAQQYALNRQDPNNADPGHSRHEFGAAIDITIINKRTGEVHSKKTDKQAWINTGVPALAKSLGLQWAGGEGSFGSYVDRVHFEVVTKTEPLSQAQLLAEEYDYIESYENAMELDRDGIFQNFKVNQFAFNFFLKRLQHSGQFRNVHSRSIVDNNGIVLSEVKIFSKKHGSKPIQ